MSKHMQMKVSILPYYSKGLAKTYPRIADAISRLDDAWVEEGPSLFRIVGKLDQLLYQLEGNQPFRATFLEHKKNLQRLYEEVEENIAEWHLAKADQALYKIEDTFDEIERELGKV